MTSKFRMKFFRGTTTQNDALTGYLGEVTVDTEKKRLRLHDNSTQGGVEFYNKGDIDTLVNDKEDVLGNPPVDGYILSSQSNGTRAWVSPTPNDDSIIVTLGEGVSVGDILYLSTDGKYYLANASDPAKSKGTLAVAAASGILNDEIVVTRQGVVSSTNLTVGTELFLSDSTNGAFSSIKPINTGSIIRSLGYALSGTSFLFKPDNIYLEIGEGVTESGDLVDSVESVDAFNAVANTRHYFTNANTTTATLPTSPVDGTVIAFKVCNGLLTNKISGNGKEIEGSSTDLIVNVANGAITLRYVNSTLQWRLV